MNTLFPHALLALSVGCTAPPKGVATDSGLEGGEAVDVIGILITPGEVIVPVGGTVQLEAVGLNAERQSIDLTDVVEWRSGAPSVANVSNGLSEEGILYGVAPGTTSVTAAFDVVESPPGRITVTDASLTDLSISPPKVIISVGETIQLSAEARFSDGAAADASSQVRWITGDAAIATLSSTGDLTGVGSGDTTVRVEWDDVTSESIRVTVSGDGGGGGGGGSVDLSISNVYATIDEDELNVWVDVENSGTSTAAGFWVDVFIDPESTPSFGDWPDTYGECDYVGPDEISTVLIQGYATADSHSLFVVVDSTDEIDETSESNNTEWAEASAGASSGDGEPNLEVDYFSYWVEDGVTEYWINVTNTGLGDAGSFYVDVFHDSYVEPAIMSTGEVYEMVTELSSGSTAYLTLTIDEDCGYCTSWLLVDSFDQVDETNESDNTDSVDIGADW